MAGYTIVNMNDLEDSAAGRDGVEARFGRKHLDSEHLGVSVFRYGPGHRNTLGHRHREQEEAYLVTAGSGRIKLGRRHRRPQARGIWCGSRRPRCARWRPGRTGWRWSRSAPTVPRAATASHRRGLVDGLMR